MRILICDEVRQAELQAVKRPGVSTLVLMQRAGYAIAQFCLSQFKFASVCVVCGQGANCGDGLVAAEALRRAVARVSVIVLAKGLDELAPDAAAACSRLEAEPIWIADEAGFETDAAREALEADLIIDAVAGRGFKPPLQSLAQKAIEAINAASGIVVSVDLPSGLDPDSATPLPEHKQDVVFAHGIVTFVAPKPAHVFAGPTSGPIAVSELGVQPSLVGNQTGLSVITGQEVGIAFPPRPDDAHKGQFGHVLVIAGSRGKAGAAALAGIAALRTGAGLVTVACPRSIQATVAGFAPELMTEDLPETEDGTIAMEASEKVEALLAGKTVVVVGPGLSRNEQTAELVRRLVSRCPLPLVLDADGLNAFAGHRDELKPSGELRLRVLTPHPGEAARLLGVATKEVQADRLAAARRIAQETGACVVLKGWRTVVAGASGETWINMTGNSAMAKGGSGDVLSGMIAAALARGADRTSAFLQDVRVAAAVYLHGLAGDLCRDMLHENAVLATDLLQNLDEAFRDCESQTDRGLFYLHR
jgi:NAD(P)H-hydrate epimerase